MCLIVVLLCVLSSVFGAGFVLYVCVLVVLLLLCVFAVCLCLWCRFVSCCFFVRALAVCVCVDVCVVVVVVSCFIVAFSWRCSCLCCFVPVVFLLLFCCFRLLLNKSFCAFVCYFLFVRVFVCVCC